MNKKSKHQFKILKDKIDDLMKNGMKAKKMKWEM